MKHPQYYLHDIIEDGMYEDVRFRNDYSGRGMYGRTCVGITGPMEDCKAVIAEAIILASIDAGTVQMGSSVQETHDVFRELVLTMMDFSQDSMGHNVILYWPVLASIPADEAAP